MCSALLVLAFSLAVGLIAQILLERPRARSYRSTLWANRRIVVTPTRLSPGRGPAGRASRSARSASAVRAALGRGRVGGDLCTVEVGEGADPEPPVAR
jgi:hypothetical protein